MTDAESPPDAADGVDPTAGARSDLEETLDDNADDLAASVETLVRLQRSGTLDDLARLADVAALASDAMDDGMVTELAATGTTLGELADAASDDDVADTLGAAIDAVGEAGAQPAEPVGALGLARSLRDPDVRRGLGFLLTVAGELGGRLDDRSGR